MRTLSALASSQDTEEGLDVLIGADIPIAVEVGIGRARRAALAGDAGKEGFDVLVGAEIAVAVVVAAAAVVVRRRAGAVAVDNQIVDGGFISRAGAGVAGGEAKARLAARREAQGREGPGAQLPTALGVGAVAGDGLGADPVDAVVD